jgi:hypothetical protein
MKALLKGLFVRISKIVAPSGQFHPTASGGSVELVQFFQPRFLRNEGILIHPGAMNSRLDSEISNCMDLTASTWRHTPPRWLPRYAAPRKSSRLYLEHMNQGLAGPPLRRLLDIATPFLGVLISFSLYSCCHTLPMSIGSLPQRFAGSLIDCDEASFKALKMPILMAAL